MANESEFFEFVLIGFPGLSERYYIAFGFLIFLIYTLSLCANFTVIVLIFFKEHLHQPMYIIIASLAISDFLFDTSTLPKMIVKYWFGAGSMTFSGCFLQMTIIHTLNPLDSFIITLMAIDRYVAILRPLRYHSVISGRLIIIVCTALYMISVAIGLYIMTLGYYYPYTGSSKVKNFFCSIATVSATAPIDSSQNLWKAYCVGLACYLGPLSFIIFSYSIIITKICSSTRSESWSKAFYTCVTHWFVIAIYFVPRLLVYSFDLFGKPPVDVYISLICLYTFVPHSTSPIIFCLRNEEIKRTLRSIFKRKNKLDTKIKKDGDCVKTIKIRTAEKPIIVGI
ncbi:olfactory receptor 1A1-like [Dendropsophus ebraccatus]|uniref:olfactory receptor 1A1-like n=1 Tax=Dendropsophus ebraccatus TaxID=150705 RepID=UPI003831B7DC